MNQCRRATRWFVPVYIGAGVAVGTSAQCLPTFVETSYGSGGCQPNQVLSTDLNGDHLPDVVVANLRDRSIGLLVNAGSGVMTLGPVRPLTGRPVNIAVGDFNQDSWPDIAAVAEQPIGLEVLISSGPLTYASSVQYPIIDGPQPGGIVVADFDNDGHLDIAANTGLVWVFRGTGGGAFAAPVSHLLPSTSGPLATGDLNRDGRPDLLAPSSSQGASLLYSFLNDGAGGFWGPFAWSTSAGPGRVEIADIDADGSPDVLHACLSGVAVFRNVSGGFLVPMGTYSFQESPSSIGIADLNGDGRLDVVGTRANGIPEAFGVRLGGDGFEFPVYTEYTRAVEPRSASIADFDQDGRPDLVMAQGECDRTPTSVAVLLNRTGPASITTQPEDTEIPPGETAVLTVGVSGQAPLAFQWRRGGAALSDTETVSGSQTATLTVANAVPDQSGLYDCRVTNPCGVSTSAAVRLLVYCPTDFNRSGIVGVQDIFDFLAAYFAGEFRADFNGSGNISVQDIFDFLAAYFARCP